MAFSVTSFFETIIFSSLMVLFLNFYLKCRKKVLYVNPNFILLCALFIIIRSFLPYEFFYTISMKSSKILPPITNFLNSKVLFNITVYNLFICVWITVALIKLICLITGQIKLEKAIQLFPNSIHSPLLNKLKEEQNIKSRIDLIEIPNLSTPALVGFKKTVIIIPDGISSKDMHYILLHEIEHYKHNDLRFIAILHLLCTIYWWNPLFYLLKKISQNFIEYRIDKSVTEHFDLDEKLNYLESILNIAKLRNDKPVKYSLGLGFYEIESSIKNRFILILNPQKKGGENFFKLFLIIILLSTFFILEPYSIKEEHSSYSYAIPKNSYFIKNNGGFDLYLNGEYSFTVDSIDEFENIPLAN